MPGVNLSAIRNDRQTGTEELGYPTAATPRRTGIESHVAWQCQRLHIRTVRMCACGLSSDSSERPMTGVTWMLDDTTEDVMIRSSLHAYGTGTRGARATPR